MAEPKTPEDVVRLFARSLGREHEAPSTAELSAAVAALLDYENEEQSEGTAREVPQRLKVRLGLSDDAPTKEETVSQLRQAYRRSASVLTAFDPLKLKPMPADGRAAPAPLKEPPDAASQLIGDLTEVYHPPAPRMRWMLKPAVRVEVLRNLGAAGRLAEALNVTPKDERPDSRLQQIVESYVLRKRQASLDSQTPAELADHLQAVRWLQPAGLSLPSPEEIQELIERKQVTAVFEQMAGDNFVGREKELKLLRDYVEVLPPSSTLRSLQRQMRRWLGLRTKAPLVVYAAGGTGKTSLISKFLLEHMEVPEALKFPYVYLDFDNPRLSLDDPNSIFDEAIRQLGVQYPDERAELAHFAADERGVSRSAAVEASSDAILDRSAALRESQAAQSAARFAGLVGRVVHRSGNLGTYSAPLLMVLDTYEEVQSRGIDQEIKLWNLMDSIQKDFPTLRIVVFGRAPLDVVPTSNTTTQTVELKDLEQEVAESLLRRLGVREVSVARSLYEEFGGNPLSLKLAAEVYHREGPKRAVGAKGWRKSLFLFAASESLVQGQLYQRILGHIHDPDVRKIAHPGLVLRRVTPELIKDVLQGPCGVEVPDLNRARELFEALGREVALVTREPDGALRHRPDVRRIMLALLARDKPEQTEEINRLAVKFYSGSSRPAERAEEIYHRLQLRESAEEIERRWLPGVEANLRGAVEELPVESRVILASYLRVSLKRADLAAAGLAEWERYTAGTAGELVRLGHYNEAMKALRERRGRTPGSPLHLVEARLYALTGRKDEAGRAVTLALQAAAVSGSRREMLDALLLASEIALGDEQTVEADEYLKQAAGVAAALEDTVKQLLAVLQRMRLRLAVPRRRKVLPDPGLRPELARLLRALPEQAWTEHRMLVRAGVSLLGFDYPDFMSRMLKVVGFGRLEKRQLSILAECVEKLLKFKEVASVHSDFARTLRLSKNLPVEQTLSALQRFERLEEYFEKLLPVIQRQPELQSLASESFALLYARQTLD